MTCRAAVDRFRQGISWPSNRMTCGPGAMRSRSLYAERPSAALRRRTGKVWRSNTRKATVSASIAVFPRGRLLRPHPIPCWRRLSSMHQPEARRSPRKPAIEDFVLLGCETNAASWGVSWVMKFWSGEVHTGYLDEHPGIAMGAVPTEGIQGACWRQRRC